MRPTSPQRTTRIFLLLCLFGCFVRGYWVYSREENAGGVGPYLDLAHGVGPAPFQYRPGVIQVANFFYVHAHLPFRYSFALLDGITSVIAVLLGYAILRRTQLYREATVALQWVASAAYSSVVIYLLSWQDWFKKNETEPSAALVMLLLWLWSADTRRKRSQGVTITAIVAITVLQSFVRADIALCIGVGIFAVALFDRRATLALDRGTALATAAFMVLAAAALQLLLMKIVFPHAKPYDGPVFMLPHDAWRPDDVLECLSYIAPAIWTAWQVRRRRFTLDSTGLGFLLAAVPFCLLWLLIGRLAEVRIFLPLGMALAPLAAQMALVAAREAEPAPSPAV